MNYLWQSDSVFMEWWMFAGDERIPIGFNSW